MLFAGREVKEPVELKQEESPESRIEVPAYTLRALPTPQLLHRHFRGDVDAYLAYIRPRARHGEMERARVRSKSR